MKKLLVFGKKGVLEETFYLEGAKFDPPKPPLVEKVFEGGTKGDLSAMAGDGEIPKKHLFDQLQEVYERYGKAEGYGHYGEVITLFEIHSPWHYYFVDSIERFTWPKGTLAVDIVPVFIDKNENAFIVCGIKEKEGVDVSVLIGGHIERHGFHLQSALEAIFEESESEAAIILKSEEDITSEPLPETVFVTLEVGGHKIDSQLTYIDCFRAGTDKKKEEEQKKAHMAHKRVDWTFVYTLAAKFEQELDKETIRGWLKAGDDLKDLLIVEVGKDEVPAFGSIHHRTIFDAVLAME